MPATLTLTAYDTGSSGFNIAVAVGKAFKDKHGTDVRVLPAGNDVARLAPLKGGRAQTSMMGIGVYFAQEGVFEFGAKAWGPQPLRVILASADCNAISLGVAKDAGVREVKDLKGKRIGVVVGPPALNQNAFGVLAFAVAWIALLKANPPDDKDAFLKAWTAARGAALKKAGSETIFE